MDCSCSVDFGFNDETRWSYQQIKKAAKRHKCYECGTPIPAGSSYFCHTIFGGGIVEHFRYCHDCQSVVDKFFTNGWYFGNVWESLSGYLYDNWREDLPSSCICKLTPGARDKVCDILEEIHTERAGNYDR